MRVGRTSTVCRYTMIKQSEDTRSQEEEIQEQKEDKKVEEVEAEVEEEEVNVSMYTSSN
jgi:hypothetical protein